MLRITGLDASLDGHRRCIYIEIRGSNDEGLDIGITGGKKLEDFFHAHSKLNCSHEDLQAALDLIENGAPPEEALMQLNPIPIR